MSASESSTGDRDFEAQLSGWARSLLARAGRARSASGDAGPLQAASRRPMALSAGSTLDLLQRVAHKAGGSRVWRPEDGPASPQALDRFAAGVAGRYQLNAQKYLPQASERDKEQESELVLAVPGGPGGEVSRETGAPEVVRETVDFASFLSSEPPAEGRAFPPLPGAEATAQPVEFGPPPWERQAGGPAARIAQRQAGVRPISRVEEITPGGRAPEGTAGRPAPVAAPDPTGPGTGEQPPMEAETPSASDAEPMEQDAAAPLPAAAAEPPGPAVRRREDPHPPAEPLPAPPAQAARRAIRRAAGQDCLPGEAGTPGPGVEPPGPAVRRRVEELPSPPEKAGPVAAPAPGEDVAATFPAPVREEPRLPASPPPAADTGPGLTRAAGPPAGAPDVARAPAAPPQARCSSSQPSRPGAAGPPASREPARPAVQRRVEARASSAGETLPPAVPRLPESVEQARLPVSPPPRGEEPVRQGIGDEHGAPPLPPRQALPPVHAQPAAEDGPRGPVVQPKVELPLPPPQQGGQAAFAPRDSGQARPEPAVRRQVPETAPGRAAPNAAPVEAATTPAGREAHDLPAPAGAPSAAPDEAATTPAGREAYNLPAPASPPAAARPALRPAPPPGAGRQAEQRAAPSSFESAAPTIRRQPAEPTPAPDVPPARQAGLEGTGTRRSPQPPPSAAETLPGHVGADEGAPLQRQAGAPPTAPARASGPARADSPVLPARTSPAPRREDRSEALPLTSRSGAERAERPGGVQPGASRQPVPPPQASPSAGAGPDPAARATLAGAGRAPEPGDSPSLQTSRAPMPDATPPVGATHAPVPGTSPSAEVRRAAAPDATPPGGATRVPVPGTSPSVGEGMAPAAPGAAPPVGTGRALDFDAMPPGEAGPVAAVPGASTSAGAGAAPAQPPIARRRERSASGEASPARAGDLPARGEGGPTGPGDLVGLQGQEDSPQATRPGARPAAPAEAGAGVEAPVLRRAAAGPESQGQPQELPARPAEPRPRPAAPGSLSAPAMAPEPLETALRPAVGRPGVGADSAPTGDIRPSRPTAHAPQPPLGVTEPGPATAAPLPVQAREEPVPGPSQSPPVDADATLSPPSLPGRSLQRQEARPSEGRGAPGARPTRPMEQGAPAAPALPLAPSGSARPAAGAPGVQRQVSEAPPGTREEAGGSPFFPAGAPRGQDPETGPRETGLQARPVEDHGEGRSSTPAREPLRPAPRGEQPPAAPLAQLGAGFEPDSPARKPLPLVERRSPEPAPQGGGARLQARREEDAGYALPGLSAAGRGPGGRVVEAAGQWVAAPVDRSLDRPLPLAAPGIQRQPLVAGTDSGGTASLGETVQRAAEGAGAEQKPGPSLEELARRVYPLVKRLLAVERERLPR